MEYHKTFPIQDGYRMPGEFEKHEGCIMIWPVRPGSWINNGMEAQKTFAKIAKLIAKSEYVWMLANQKDFDLVTEIFSKDDNIFVLNIETDDAWARDVAPTFVIDNNKDVRGIDWKFNAWGGDVDGLYADWDKDDEAALKICQALGLECYDAKDFVLEGGSIHSDGEGTVLVTESCLLSPGRNPSLSKEEIEDNLKKYLGAKKVIWLPRGIYMDETNEHVDNVCAFVKPGEVVLAWTKDKNDPQWELSNACLKTLGAEKDAMGRKIKVHFLMIPDKPVCITKEELEGFEFEEGEQPREEGERLAASYVNFYISNKSVLVPQFGDVNDKEAIKLLSELFTDRNIIPIPARPIIVGGGNIHCITQQVPKGRLIRKV